MSNQHIRERMQKSTRSLLLLGLEHVSNQPAIGFSSSSTVDKPNHSELPPFIEYDGDAHLVTAAPTRSGKGVGVVITNALMYEGSIVMFDPKGEAAMVTARRRREMGQRVVMLDPFHVVAKQSDSLNPFDIFGLRTTDLDADAQMLAEMLSRGIQGQKEPFWDLSGCGLISALTSYVAKHEDHSKRNLAEVLALLTSDDVVYQLAVILDTKGKTMSRTAYREIASFLQLPDITRGGVLATAQTYLKAFTSQSVLESISQSSFSLIDFMEGCPTTIYIIIPPDRISAYRGLLKLWVGTLLKAVFNRTSRPPLRTLFLLDEAAQLETFPLLESMMTLSAGYACWIWLILQDLGQLQHYYPQQWTTILNNCGVMQLFGIQNRQMGTSWSNYLDSGVSELLRHGPAEQMLLLNGREQRCRRLNYLTDERFQGLYDANLLYTPSESPEKSSGNTSLER